MQSGEIRDNTAVGSGGGLYAAGQIYRSPLTAADYPRIAIGPTAIFSGNQAVTGAYQPPNTAALDPRIETTSSSIFHHPINNFDLNFQYEIQRRATFFWNYNREDPTFLQRTLPQGEAFAPPAAPERSGYLFRGWYLDPEGSLPYDFDLPLLANLSLYARWEPEPEPKPLSPHWAYLIGDTTGHIRPKDHLTRAEAATIFFRIISDEHRAAIWSQTNPFPDVLPHHWFNNATSTTTRGGLFIGMPDDSFAPNRPITRGEFATVMARLMGLGPEGEPLFTDIEDHWAKAAINAVGHYGWIKGPEGPDGPFLPDKPITRAEVAASVNRMLNRLPENLGDLLPGMHIWPDNANLEEWYYLYLQEAANSHYYVRMSDGIHEKWLQLIHPERPWALLELPESKPEDIFPQ